MKKILPWLLVVALGAGAGALYVSNSSKIQKIDELLAQAKQSDDLQSKLDAAQKTVADQNDQIASIQKDTQELMRLRNQVKQLGDDKAQLTKQLAMAQSQAQRSQAEIQQVQARVSENAKAMAEQQILQAKQNQNAVATCINYLRQIDGAKQQWALENNKGPDAVPQPQDLLPYFPNHQIPLCPAGGRYTLNAVNRAPTCSIPGHVLQ
jgi:septal ring factor EnvC (AmiA/AmiB activator)